MARHKLRDDQWQKIKGLLPGKKGDLGVTAKNNRRFIDAALWIARTGGHWHELPQEFGKWNSVFQRYDRWSAKGIWENFFNAMVDDPDFEFVMMDATIIRAHQQAPGQRGGQETQDIGCSRGGLTTKVHACVTLWVIRSASFSHPATSLTAHKQSCCYRSIPLST